MAIYDKFSRRFALSVVQFPQGKCVTGELGVSEAQFCGWRTGEVALKANLFVGPRLLQRKMCVT